MSTLFDKCVTGAHMAFPGPQIQNILKSTHLIIGDIDGVMDDVSNQGHCLVPLLCKILCSLLRLLDVCLQLLRLLLKLCCILLRLFQQLSRPDSDISAPTLNVSLLWKAEML